MTWHDDVLAARLALPPEARPTGITRLQLAGLGFGPKLPLHFVVPGDLHLELIDVFLHRTVLMPPVDQGGVSVAAALVAFCADARTIDAIKAGCWALHEAHMELEEVESIVREQPWRMGVRETGWVLEHLDGRCRSLPEAELLALARIAGLPEPEVNLPLTLEDGSVVIPDLWYPRQRRAVEYEGSHHQQARDQYRRDIDRSPR